MIRAGGPPLHPLFLFQCTSESLTSAQPGDIEFFLERSLGAHLCLCPEPNIDPAWLFTSPYHDCVVLAIFLSDVEVSPPSRETPRPAIYNGTICLLTSEFIQSGVSREGQTASKFSGDP